MESMIGEDDAGAEQIHSVFGKVNTELEWLHAYGTGFSTWRSSCPLYSIDKLFR